MDVLDLVLVLLSWNLFIAPIMFTLIVYFEMDPLSVIFQIVIYRFKLGFMTAPLPAILAKLFISITWLVTHFEGLQSVRMTFVFMVQSLAIIIKYLKHLTWLYKRFGNPRHLLKSYRRLYYCFATSSTLTSSTACLFMSVGLLLQVLCWSLLIEYSEKSLLIIGLVVITLVACMISLVVALPFALYCRELSICFLRKMNLHVTFGFGIHGSMRKEVRSLQPISFHVGSFRKLDREAQVLYLQTIIIYTINMIMLLKLH